MSLPMTLVLGTKRYSSWSLRPWLAAKVAGLAFEEINIALRQPNTKEEILKISPSGKIPLLIHGDLKIWDSLAICEYLAELKPNLWPKDPKARAMARSICAEMHAGFMTLRNVCSMDVVEYQPTPIMTPELEADLSRIMLIWNEARRQFGQSGPFLFGEFSIADAFYAPVVTRFTTFGITMDNVSKAYTDAVWALPAMQEWKERAIEQLKQPA